MEINKITITVSRSKNFQKIEQSVEVSITDDTEDVIGIRNYFTNQLNDYCESFLDTLPAPEPTKIEQNSQQPRQNNYRKPMVQQVQNMNPRPQQKNIYLNNTIQLQGTDGGLYAYDYFQRNDTGEKFYAFSKKFNNGLQYDRSIGLKQFYSEKELS